MKYIIIFLVLIILLNCSHKVAPDFSWNHQRWVVVEMKGVSVQQSGGRKDAYISFEIGDKKITGNGGCNIFNGNYSVDRNTIHFTEVMATKMSCNDIDFENAFLSTLATVDHYEMRGNDLLLKRKKNTVLVLRSQ